MNAHFERSLSNLDKNVGASALHIWPRSELNLIHYSTDRGGLWEAPFRFNSGDGGGGGSRLGYCKHLDSSPSRSAWQHGIDCIIDLAPWSSIGLYITSLSQKNGLVLFQCWWWGVRHGGGGRNWGGPRFCWWWWRTLHVIVMVVWLLTEQ